MCTGWEMRQCAICNLAFVVSKSPSRPFRNVVSIICRQTLMYSVWIVPLRIKLPLKSTENCSYCLPALSSYQQRENFLNFFISQHCTVRLWTDFESGVLKFRLGVHVVDLCSKSWPGSWDLAQALAACKKSKQRSFGIRREMNMAKTHRHYWPSVCPLACFLSHTNMTNSGTSHH